MPKIHRRTPLENEMRLERLLTKAGIHTMEQLGAATDEDLRRAGLTPIEIEASKHALREHAETTK